MIELTRRTPLDLLQRLEREGKVTPVSLDLSEPELDWERFASVCAYLGSLRDATAWWIADALILGDARFGFEASQADALLRRSPETLRRWQWVAERVPKTRRREGLTFTHHEVVAALEPGQQEKWLRKAEEAGLSSAQLRSAIKSTTTSNCTQCSAPNNAAEGAVQLLEEAARAVCRASIRRGRMCEVPTDLIERLASAIGETSTQGSSLFDAPVQRRQPAWA
jgi:hypothetical protein